jgi:hypothetical protein
MMTMNRNVTQLAPRALYQSKFNSARYNLLLVVAMTAINVVLLMLGGSSYFLFSATVPYSLAIDGMYMTGRMPEDWYTDWPETIPFLDSGYMTVMMVIAFAIILVYLACFFFSKNFKGGWMIAAAVIFSLDTLYLVFIYGVGVDSIMDLLLHAWVLYYLISGSVYGIKLKKLPEDEPVQENYGPIEVPVVEVNTPAEEKTENNSTDEK